MVILPPLKPGPPKEHDQLRPASKQTTCTCSWHTRRSSLTMYSAACLAVVIALGLLWVEPPQAPRQGRHSKYERLPHSSES